MLATNYWTERGVLMEELEKELKELTNGGVGEGAEETEGFCSPMEGATVSTGKTPPPQLPGTGLPTKEYIWRDPWC
jgi:hypothetical protein